MNTDPALAAEAFRRGASGYVLKTCAASELTIAIREILNGRSYLTPAIARETVDVLSRQDKEFIDEGLRLTERQREVLQLLTEGKSMKEVAYAEYNREHRCLPQVPNHGSLERQKRRRAGSMRDQKPYHCCIKNYLRAIYDKVGLWNRVEIALWY
jgi:hypothetical protein